MLNLCCKNPKCLNEFLYHGKKKKETDRIPCPKCKYVYPLWKLKIKLEDWKLKNNCQESQGGSKNLGKGISHDLPPFLPALTKIEKSNSKPKSETKNIHTQPECKDEDQVSRIQPQETSNRSDLNSGRDNLKSNELDDATKPQRKALPKPSKEEKPIGETFTNLADFNKAVLRDNFLSKEKSESSNSPQFPVEEYEEMPIINSQGKVERIVKYKKLGTLATITELPSGLRQKGVVNS